MPSTPEFDEEAGGIVEHDDPNPLPAVPIEPVPYIPRPGQAGPDTQPVIDDPHAALGSVLADIQAIGQNAGAMQVSGTYGDIHNQVKKLETAIGGLLQWTQGIQPIIEAAKAAVPAKEAPKDDKDDKDAKIAELEGKIETQRKKLAAHGE